MIENRKYPIILKKEQQYCRYTGGGSREFGDYEIFKKKGK